MIAVRLRPQGEPEPRRTSRYAGLDFEAVIDGVRYPILDISQLGIRLGPNPEGHLPDYQPDDNIIFEIAKLNRRRRTLFETFGYVVWRTDRALGLRYLVMSRHWPLYLERVNQIKFSVIT